MLRAKQSCYRAFVDQPSGHAISTRMALLIETSNPYARNLLYGIRSYVRELAFISSMSEYSQSCYLHKGGVESALSCPFGKAGGHRHHRRRTHADPAVGEAGQRNVRQAAPASKSAGRVKLEVCISGPADGRPVRRNAPTCRVHAGAVPLRRPILPARKKNAAMPAARNTK